MFSQQEIKEILSIKGETRADEAGNDYLCIEKLEGKEGLEKIKGVMKNLGALEDFEQKKDKWVAVAKDILLVAVAADLFGWDDAKIKLFGKSLVKVSFSEKIFIKYFISVEKVVKSVSSHWRRFFSTGEMVPVEFNEKDGYAVINLFNFKAHPTYYKMLAGYLEAVVGLAVNPEATVEDRECPDKKKDCCQFLFKWKI